MFMCSAFDKIPGGGKDCSTLKENNKLENTLRVTTGQRSKEKELEKNSLVDLNIKSLVM